MPRTRLTCTPTLRTLLQFQHLPLSALGDLQYLVTMGTIDASRCEPGPPVSLHGAIMNRLSAIALILLSATPFASAAQSSHRAAAYGSAYSQPKSTSTGYGSAYGQPVHVDSYTRTDGTYVQPHYRTSADDTRSNNYSAKGNVNPYTDQPGTKNPYGY